MLKVYSLNSVRSSLADTSVSSLVEDRDPLLGSQTGRLITFEQ